MSEFIDRFSRRIRRALRVLGHTQGDCEDLILDGYILDFRTTFSGDEILVIWASVGNWTRDRGLYVEINNDRSFENSDWEHLVNVSRQIQSLMVLDELADV